MSDWLRLSRSAAAFLFATALMLSVSSGRLGANPSNGCNVFDDSSTPGFLQWFGCGYFYKDQYPNAADACAWMENHCNTLAGVYSYAGGYEWGCGANDEGFAWYITSYYCQLHN